MTVQARAPRSLLGIASLSGTAWVAAGTLLLGASGYAFLTLTTALVAPDDYAALAALYLLIAVIGPGIFVPVEQETTRLVSRWHALGYGTRQVVVRLGRLTAAILAVALALLLAASPFLLDSVFNGQVGLLVALLLSVVGFAGLHLSRGLFAGQRRLRGYAACVGGEGLVRLLPCVVLAVAGVTQAVPYGVAIALGPLVAFLVTLPWLRPGPDGPTVPHRELATAVGALMAAWLLSLSMANIAPVIVKVMLPEAQALAGTFAFAFVLARIPLFVLFSLQALLLPALSHAAATRDVAGQRRGIRQALLLVGGLGVLAVALTAPLGGWLIGVLFEGRPTLSALTLTTLALGAVAAMVIQVLQPALIAVAGHRIVAWAWLAGAVSFAAAFALPVQPVTAATIAQVAGAVVTAGILATALRRHLRRTRLPEEDLA